MTVLASPPAPADSLTAHGRADHAVLNSLLRLVCADVDAGRLDAARAGCEAFERRMAQHIRLEERLLFPLFEARVGLLGGPTAALRQEHREIERSVALMCESLARGDAEGFRDTWRFLRTTLRHHQSREEHVLFPATDAALSEDERAAAEERLRREPRGR